MTIYGVDVASYQGNPSWSRVYEAGVRFAFSKVTQSTNYVNPTWSHNKAGMLGLGDRFLGGAYHFLHGGDGAAQARFFLSKAGDVSKLAVALDVEAGGADAATSRAWVKEFKRLTGGHPVIGYYPRWYWDQTGRPDLSFFDTIWQSRYVSGSGSPTGLFSRVPAAWWTTFGSEPISILQFSSSGTVAGISGHCDVNAYRGTLAELRALALGTPQSPPAPVPKPAEPQKEEEEDVRYYGLLTDGPAAITPISIHPGDVSSIGFWCDNDLADLPAAKLRVAIHDAKGWYAEHLTVDSTTAKPWIKFRDAKTTDGLSVQREDDGAVPVAFDAS